MVGKLNILKEKQHKTKQKKNKQKKKTRKPHPLVRPWELKNKQTKITTRRQKLDPTPMPLEIKIMMCA